MATLRELLSADDPDSLFGRLQSHALTSGWFDTVNGHEPQTPPASGGGLTAALWVDRVDPAAPASGLAATSARIVWFLRLFTSVLYEPADAIDPRMLSATADLMESFTGGFTLGGLVRDVDVLGKHGVALAAQAGYVPYDSALYRVMTLTVPVVVNDAFPQET